jgi:hypothetical protein
MGDPRGEIVARLVTELDGVVAAIAAKFPSDAVEGRHRPRAELLASVRGLTEIVLRAVAGARLLAEPEVAIVEQVGVRGANDGVPAEALIIAARVGIEELYRHLLKVAAEPPVDTATVELVGAMSLQLLDIRHQLTDAIRRAYSTPPAMPSRVQAQALFVHQLLEARQPAEDELRRMADDLGFYLGPPCGALLVLPAAAGDLPGLERAVSALVAALPASLAAAPRTAPTLHVTLLVPSRRPSSWARACEQARQVATDDGAVILAVEPRPSLASVGPTYRDARSCLLTLRRRAAPGGVVSMRDLDLSRLLDLLPVRERVTFLRATLAPVLALRPAQAQPLLDTLAILQDCDGSVLDAARRLGLHVKGLRYRLRKLHVLTGLSPDVPGDRLRLDVALQIYRLGGVPPCGDPEWAQDCDATIPMDSKPSGTLVGWA